MPLAGLPFVAAALAGLVAAIASNTLWGLDFFRVAAGGLWTGKVATLIIVTKLASS